MVSIQTLTSAHATQLMSLEEAIFVNDKYTLQQFKTMLDDDNYDKLGLFKEQKMVAFILILKSLDFNELIKIGVLPQYRRKQYATKLIEAIITLSKGKKIFLEVNENNYQAIVFYQKFNFKTYNIRKSYYNNDSALIMVLNSIQ